MRKPEQLYEVELRSKALLSEGKKSFITYFKGGNKKTMVSNMRALYPQWTKEEDYPVVDITPISQLEYQKRIGSDMIKHKAHLVKERVDIA